MVYGQLPRGANQTSMYLDTACGPLHPESLKHGLSLFHGLRALGCLTWAQNQSNRAGLLAVQLGVGWPVEKDEFLRKGIAKSLALRPLRGRAHPSFPREGCQRVSS